MVQWTQNTCYISTRTRVQIPRTYTLKHQGRAVLSMGAYIFNPSTGEARAEGWRAEADRQI